MQRQFKDFSVEIVDKKFKNNSGANFQQTAIITFNFEDNESKKNEFGYLSIDEIYNFIDQGIALNLDNCYIENFSLSKYRELRDFKNEKRIKLINFCASHAFFNKTDDELDSFDFNHADLTGRKTNFSHAMFVCAPVDFSATKFAKGGVNFEYCYFRNGNVTFREAFFAEGDVSFKNSIFNEGTKNFEDAIFEDGHVLFLNTEFGNGDASFAGVNFGSGRVSFKVARFDEGKVDFSRAVFGKGEKIFEMVKFGDGNVSFRSTDFGDGKVDFTRSEFGNGQKSFVNMEVKKGNVSFVNTAFNEGKISFKLARFEQGDVDFHFSTFGKGDIIFDRAYFGNGIVDFRAVDFSNGKLNFYRTEFIKGDIIFEACHFDKGSLTFKHTSFGKGTLNFNMAELGNTKVAFRNVSFDNDTVSFNKAKIKDLAITSCLLNNFFDLRVEKCETLDLSESIIRDIIDIRPYEFDIDIKAIDLSGVRLLGRIYLDWLESDVKRLIYAQGKNYRSLSEQFRVLKENYNSIGQYSYEDEAYIEFKRTELKANLKDSTEKKPISKLWQYPAAFFQWLLFDKTGKYATDPVRVLISMFVVYLFFTLLYIILPTIIDSNIISSLFEPGDPRDLSIIQKAFYHSGITFLTIGYGDYYPSGLIRWLSNIEGFVGLFLMSYFTVAFVRKILR